MTKGRSAFTNLEAKAIRRLLDQKCQAPANEQKSLRGKLLRHYGFYITDFVRDQRGFTAADFAALIESGKITIS